MKTYVMKASDVQKDWYVIDASNLVVGRLAVIIANYLRGKHKPTYDPSKDCGDYIIVVNARNVAMTGNKSDRQLGNKYYWHTGYPGGIKEVTVGKVLEGKFPERVIKKAVERMLAKNRISRQHMSNLFVYKSSEHPHQAQQPKILDVAGMNKKNIREE